MNKDRLYIRNFGPLKEIEIELSQINVLIGANGSGKSVLAKIITIVLDPINYTIDNGEVLQKFDDYHINYMTNESIIRYYTDDSIIFELVDVHINKSIDKPETRPQDFKIRDFKQMIIGGKVATQYIPAERSLISLFSKSLSSFVVSGIPLPKFLLNFSSEYEKARQEIKKLDFLDMKYVNSGKDLIYYTQDEYVDLEYSSSGVQSSLPLYLTVKYFANKHKYIIIEEPEQNLFPKAQVDTINYIIKQITKENKLFMMTHSPYVLSALNILLFAGNIANMDTRMKEEVSKLYSEELWIDSDNFSAYYLEDGIARDIKSSRGLISENEIDDISEDIAGDFDALLNIYRSHKNAHQ